jgi:hypothetical protein
MGRENDDPACNATDPAGGASAGRGGEDGQGAEAAALARAFDAGALDDAAARLSRLAPQWYREARHRELVAACDRLEAEVGQQPLPESLALWRALATWYVDVGRALAQFRALAARRGLSPDRPPARLPALGEDLYLLAALYRSELASLAPRPRLEELAGMLARHLDAPDRPGAPPLCQLGAVTALLSWGALTGEPAAAQAGRGAESLALVARLDDRHSLCSAVALARWPLLRGEMALARETCELITVGLLAGDDAHMPLAHGWLMAVQAALARPGGFELLRAWQDDSMDRQALLGSPIAPSLLGALALLDAHAPRDAGTDLPALVLARQERWPLLERWFARAARTLAHLRDGDLPAARALLRLLHGEPLPAGSLLPLLASLLEAQAHVLEGSRRTGAAEPTGVASALPDPQALRERGWPGPALLVHLLHWADPTRPVAPQDVAQAEAAWQQHHLALPLFTVPAVARRALERLQNDPTLAAAAPGWLDAAAQALGEPAAQPGPHVVVRLLDGLAIDVDGRPLAWGRKPPRRLLELVALLALQAPAETPPHRLADALYPELEGDAARRALDTALYRLRRLLPAGALRRGAVGVALSAEGVQIDRSGPRSRWLPEFEQPWAEAARRS